MPKTTIRRLSATVQIEPVGTDCGRLVCRNCGNRTTAIWLDEIDEWAADFMAWHDGQRDCSVPNYGEGDD